MTSTPTLDPRAQSATNDASRWRRALVYGLGASGRAAAELLRAHGVDVVAFDQRPADAVVLGDVLGAEVGVGARDGGSRGLRLELGREPDTLPDDLSWSAIDAVVVSPGVPSDRPLLEAARAAGVPVLAEVELAYPFLDGPIVGITGSNGKSTVTAMTGAILEAAGWDARVCGNFGEPLAAVAPRPGRAVENAVENTVENTGAAASERIAYVVELSSFQLESVDRFRPQAAALLNLAADHLDRHGDLASYLAAKRRIFARQTADDVAVLPLADAELAATEVASRRRHFALERVADDGRRVEDGCFLDGDAVVEVGPEGDSVQSTQLFTLDDLPGGHPAPHLVENAMAAALLARAVGVEPEAIARGLRGFRGLPHRAQTVALVRGVTWIDDSKGTNPAATARALEGFEPGTVRVILGGRAKGTALDALAARVAERAAKAYLIGESAADFAAALERVDAPHETTETLDRAVARAAAEAEPGTAVLLSPACASFDQFRSFVERGEVFQRLVGTLKAASGEEAGDGA